MDNRIAAFTGHRPQKLPWRYNESSAACSALKEALMGRIGSLVEGGVTDFLSGMAQGTDIWCAEAVLTLRNSHPLVKLHCVLPCMNQTVKWSAQEQERYQTILCAADSCVYTGQEYHRDCMMKRNRYLVDHSEILFAVYNGQERSGTAATIRYARKKKREIFILSPLTLDLTHEEAFSDRGK